jgi:hypothetical protein
MLLLEKSLEKIELLVNQKIKQAGGVLRKTIQNSDFEQSLDIMTLYMKEYCQCRRSHEDAIRILEDTLNFDKNEYTMEQVLGFLDSRLAKQKQEKQSLREQIAVLTKQLCKHTTLITTKKNIQKENIQKLTTLCDEFVSYQQKGKDLLIGMLQIHFNEEESKKSKKKKIKVLLLQFLEILEGNSKQVEEISHYNPETKNVLKIMNLPDLHRRVNKFVRDYISGKEFSFIELVSLLEKYLEKFESYIIPHLRADFMRPSDEKIIFDIRLDLMKKSDKCKIVSDEVEKIQQHRSNLVASIDNLDVCLRWK